MALYKYAYYYYYYYKYADTDLVVPNIFSLIIAQELQHISDWTKHHNLKLETKSNQEPGNNY